jgi:hypothetical protein
MKTTKTSVIIASLWAEIQTYGLLEYEADMLTTKKRQSVVKGRKGSL